MEESVEHEFDLRLKDLINLEFDIDKDLALLRECTGPMRVVLEYNTTIKRKLKDLHQKRKELKKFAREQRKEDDTKALLERVARHKTQEENLTSSLRQCNIRCKQNMEKEFAREKEQLLLSSPEGVKKRQAKTRMDLLRTSNQLTEDLRRIRGRMANETLASTQTLSSLQNSSKEIESTVLEHRGLSGSVRLGKSVLNKLKKRDLTDKLLILFGLLFFMLVVLYIVKKRLKITFGFFS